MRCWNMILQDGADGTCNLRRTKLMRKMRRRRSRSSAKSEWIRSASTKNSKGLPESSPLHSELIPLPFWERQNAQGPTFHIGGDFWGLRWWTYTIKYEWWTKVRHHWSSYSHGNYIGPCHLWVILAAGWSLWGTLTDYSTGDDSFPQGMILINHLLTDSHWSPWIMISLACF